MAASLVDVPECHQARLAELRPGDEEYLGGDKISMDILCQKVRTAERQRREEDMLLLEWAHRVLMVSSISNAQQSDLCHTSKATSPPTSPPEGPPLPHLGTTHSSAARPDCAHPGTTTTCSSQYWKYPSCWRIYTGVLPCWHWAWDALFLFIHAIGQWLSTAVVVCCGGCFPARKDTITPSSSDVESPPMEVPAVLHQLPLCDVCDIAPSSSDVESPPMEVPAAPHELPLCDECDTMSGDESAEIPQDTRLCRVLVSHSDHQQALTRSRCATGSKCCHGHTAGFSVGKWVYYPPSPPSSPAALEEEPPDETPGDAMEAATQPPDETPGDAMETEEQPQKHAMETEVQPQKHAMEMMATEVQPQAMEVEVSSPNLRAALQEAYGWLGPGGTLGEYRAHVQTLFGVNNSKSLRDRVKEHMKHLVGDATMLPQQVQASTPCSPEGPDPYDGVDDGAETLQQWLQSSGFFADGILAPCILRDTQDVTRYCDAICCAPLTSHRVAAIIFAGDATLGQLVLVVFDSEGPFVYDPTKRADANQLGMSTWAHLKEIKAAVERVQHSGDFPMGDAPFTAKHRFKSKYIGTWAELHTASRPDEQVAAIVTAVLFQYSSPHRHFAHLSVCDLGPVQSAWCKALCQKGHVSSYCPAGRDPAFTEVATLVCTMLGIRNAHCNRFLAHHIATCRLAEQYSQHPAEALQQLNTPQGAMLLSDTSCWLQLHCVRCHKEFAMTCGPWTDVKCAGCGRCYHQKCFQQEEDMEASSTTNHQGGMVPLLQYCRRCVHLPPCVRNVGSAPSLYLRTVEDIGSTRLTEERMYEAGAVDANDLMYRFTKHADSVVDNTREPQVDPLKAVILCYCCKCSITHQPAEDGGLPGLLCDFKYPDGTCCKKVWCEECSTCKQGSCVRLSSPSEHQADKDKEQLSDVHCCQGHRCSVCGYKAPSAPATTLDFTARLKWMQEHKYRQVHACKYCHMKGVCEDCLHKSANDPTSPGWTPKCAPIHQYHNRCWITCTSCSAHKASLKVTHGGLLNTRTEMWKRHEKLTFGPYGTEWRLATVVGTFWLSSDWSDMLPDAESWSLLHYGGVQCGGGMGGKYNGLFDYAWVKLTELRALEGCHQLELHPTPCDSSQKRTVSLVSGSDPDGAPLYHRLHKARIIAAGVLEHHPQSRKYLSWPALVPQQQFQLVFHLGVAENTAGCSTLTQTLCWMPKDGFVVAGSKHEMAAECFYYIGPPAVHDMTHSLKQAELSPPPLPATFLERFEAQFLESNHPLSRKAERTLRNIMTALDGANPNMVLATTMAQKHFRPAHQPAHLALSPELLKVFCSPSAFAYAGAASHRSGDHSSDDDPTSEPEAGTTPDQHQQAASGTPSDGAISDEEQSDDASQGLGEEGESAFSHQANASTGMGGRRMGKLVAIQSGHADTHINFMHYGVTHEDLAGRLGCGPMVHSISCTPHATAATLHHTRHLRAQQLAGVSTVGGEGSRIPSLEYDGCSIVAAAPQQATSPQPSDASSHCPLLEVLLRVYRPTATRLKWAGGSVGIQKSVKEALQDGSDGALTGDALINVFSEPCHIAFFKTDVSRLSGAFREAGLEVREHASNDTNPFSSTRSPLLTDVVGCLKSSNIRIAALSLYGQQNLILLGHGPEGAMQHPLYSSGLPVTRGGLAQGVSALQHPRKSLEASVAEVSHLCAASIDITLRLPNGRQAPGSAGSEGAPLVNGWMHLPSHPYGLAEESQVVGGGQSLDHFISAASGTFRQCCGGGHREGGGGTPRRAHRMEPNGRKLTSQHPFAQYCNAEVYPYGGFTDWGSMKITFNQEALSRHLSLTFQAEGKNLHDHRVRLDELRQALDEWEKNGNGGSTQKEVRDACLVAYTFRSLMCYCGGFLHLVKRCHSVSMSWDGVVSQDQARKIYREVSSVRAHVEQHGCYDTYSRMEAKTAQMAPHPEEPPPLDPGLAARALCVLQAAVPLWLGLVETHIPMDILMRKLDVTLLQLWPHLHTGPHLYPKVSKCRMHGPTEDTRDLQTCSGDCQDWARACEVNWTVNWLLFICCFTTPQVQKQLRFGRYSEASLHYFRDGVWRTVGGHNSRACSYTSTLVFDALTYGTLGKLWEAAEKLWGMDLHLTDGVNLVFLLGWKVSNVKDAQLSQKMVLHFAHTFAAHHIHALCCTPPAAPDGLSSGRQLAETTEQFTLAFEEDMGCLDLKSVETWEHLVMVVTDLALMEYKSKIDPARAIHLRKVEHQGVWCAKVCQLLANFDTSFGEGEDIPPPPSESRPPAAAWRAHYAAMLDFLRHVRCEDFVQQLLVAARAWEANPSWGTRRGAGRASMQRPPPSPQRQPPTSDLQSSMPQQPSSSRGDFDTARDKQFVLNAVADLEHNRYAFEQISGSKRKSALIRWARHQTAGGHSDWTHPKIYVGPRGDQQLILPAAWSETLDIASVTLGGQSGQPVIQQLCWLAHATLQDR